MLEAVREYNVKFFEWVYLGIDKAEMINNQAVSQVSGVIDVITERLGERASMCGLDELGSRYQHASTELFDSARALGQRAEEFAGELIDITENEMFGEEGEETGAS